MYLDSEGLFDEFVGCDVIIHRQQMNGDLWQEILQTEQWQVGPVLQVNVQHASNAYSKMHCRERCPGHGSGAEERDSGHTLEWKIRSTQSVHYTTQCKWGHGMEGSGTLARAIIHHNAIE